MNGMNVVQLMFVAHFTQIPVTTELRTDKQFCIGDCQIREQMATQLIQKWIMVCIQAKSNGNLKQKKVVVELKAMANIEHKA